MTDHQKHCTRNLIIYHGIFSIFFPQMRQELKKFMIIKPEHDKNMKLGFLHFSKNTIVSTQPIC